MLILSVGEFKADFSNVLEKVRHGERIGIHFGRRKTPVAVLVPYRENGVPARRTLGILEGKASVAFNDDFAMTEEELIGDTHALSH